MNMMLKQDAFDVREAHPLKQAHLQPTPARGRFWAALITIAAHVVIVIGLTEGLYQSQMVHHETAIVVHIEPEKQKPEVIPPPMAPALVKPSVITAPMPDVTVAPAPKAIAASPPTALTPPPPVAAAPSPVQSNSNAIPTWQGMMMARLEQAKRYPESARFHRQQGIVLLHFTMDRDGKVLSASIQKGSGFDALDQETLALIQRAQPLPKPPPEMKGDPVELVVPIEFYLNVHRR